MLKIYLVRHGQNLDNVNGILNGHRDEPLTLLGESQAVSTANHIKELNLVFDFVYSSPLIRAYKTAEIITNTLKLDKPNTLDLLIERNFGVMTGKQISRIVRYNEFQHFMITRVTFSGSSTISFTCTEQHAIVDGVLGATNLAFGSCTIPWANCSL